MLILLVNWSWSNSTTHYRRNYTYALFRQLNIKLQFFLLYFTKKGSKATVYMLVAGDKGDETVAGKDGDEVARTCTQRKLHRR
jgi:hypothetical protein